MVYETISLSLASFLWFPLDSTDRLVLHAVDTSVPKRKITDRAPWTREPKSRASGGKKNNERRKEIERKGRVKARLISSLQRMGFVV